MSCSQNTIYPPVRDTPLLIKKVESRNDGADEMQDLNMRLRQMEVPCAIHDSYSAMCFAARRLQLETANS